MSQPPKININEFFEGVDSDTDVLRIKNSACTDMQNMRIIDVEGKGLTATNIGGTEERFRLTGGFVPIGSVEYNGVSYIASHNEYAGLGELGCYPAPRSLVNEDCSLTGWDSTNKEYAPLFNFTNGNNPRLPGTASAPFRTSLFNFSLDRQIEMIVREDFDGSVNLYLAQEGNPIRVFNSGFNQQGDCTQENRRYWDKSFPNEVNLLNESENHLNIEFVRTEEGGRLRSGGWIFFFRYANENYDRTSFFAESNNVVISPGDYNQLGVRKIGDIGNETNTSVLFEVSEIDPAYSFIEIGYIYNNDGSLEYGIFDERYNIDPLTTSQFIRITGFEVFTEVDISEIVGVKPVYDGAFTHEQLENRYFAANLFDTTNFNDDAATDLYNFSQLVTANFNDSLQLQHVDSSVPYQDVFSSGYFKGIYNSEKNCYSYVGYFRGESYAFGIVFILKNGRETASYPIQGRDDWDLASPTTNNEGIYRFPTTNNSPLVSGDFVNVMGVDFNITAAVGAITPWMQDNVAGFYFTRSERKRNLLYQGLTTSAFTSTEPDASSGYLFANKPYDIKFTEMYFPSLDQNGVMQFIVRFDASLFESIWTYPHYTTLRSIVSPSRSAFFSIDHFLRKSVPVNKLYYKAIGGVGFNTLITSEDNQEKYYWRDTSYSYSNNTTSLIDVANIAPWYAKNNNKFVSYFVEGSTSEINSFQYFFVKNFTSNRFTEIKNQEIASNSYIGLFETYVPNRNVVNLYLSDPDPSVFDISKLYDVKSTFYQKISKFYKLNDVAIRPVVDTVYKGDCFLQRSFLKARFNPKYSPSLMSDHEGANLDPNYPGTGEFATFFQKRTFAFGEVFSIITENENNAELRSEDNLNKFAPGTANSVYDFAVKNIDRESELFNEGYNQQLSPKRFLGFNIDIPFFPENKPAGIMYSRKYIAGSFLDSYRQIDLAALKEYDYRMGSIKKIVNQNGTLVSIQEFGINRHLINERALLNQQNPTSSSLILGIGNVLDDKSINLSDFVGSQHQWSIVKTDKSTYGFDLNKRKAWRILPDMNVDIISDTKLYRSKTYDICEFESEESDISETIPDNPVNRGGIVGYFDRKFNDIYFTIIKKNEKIPDSQIVFNEWLDKFNGERTFISPFAITINEDFFSFNPNIFPSITDSPSIDGDAWIHDVFESGGLDNATTFYGNVDPEISYVEFVVHQQADITKIFDKLDVSSSPVELHRIVYETQDQNSQQFPFVDGLPENFWRDPVYQENLWRVPILRAESVNSNPNNIYEVDSRLRGRWMKVRLEYKTKSSIFIKSTLTTFRNSSY